MAKAKSLATLARPMPITWHAIISGMVLEGLDFAAAGVKAGLSKSYVNGLGLQIIKQDKRFQKAIASKLAVVAGKIGWDLSRWDKEAAALYVTCLDNGDRATAVSVLDKIAKRIGAYSLDHEHTVKVLPPTDEERDAWLNKYRRMELDILDVTDAICRE